MRGTVVVGRHWKARQNELAFVTRSIAGAAARCGPVSVLVPGPTGRHDPDGLFDLEGIGEDGGLCWPEAYSDDRAIVIDEVTSELVDLLALVDHGSVFYIASPFDVPAGWRQIHLVDKKGGTALPLLGVHVPINQLATRHRHHGFGFTGHLLVLSDGSGSGKDPPAPAAWLTSAFSDAHVVVVENAVASAWKARVLRGTVAVSTRMDLWRLVAHAGVCVDLSPGHYIARECVEALRLGTPIVVPEESGAAAAHTSFGTGSTFADPGELLKAVRGLQNVHTREAAAKAGREYADTRYGDVGTLVATVRTLLVDP